MGKLAAPLGFPTCRCLHYTAQYPAIVHQIYDIAYTMAAFNELGVSVESGKPGGAAKQNTAISDINLAPRRK